MGKLFVMPQRMQTVESEWTSLKEEVRRAMSTPSLTNAALALAEEYGADAVVMELGEHLDEALELLQEIDVGMIFENLADKAEMWNEEYALVGRLHKAFIAVEALEPEFGMA